MADHTLPRANGALTPLTLVRQTEPTENRSMAGGGAAARAACIRYTECDWGDLIDGTKEQLQALGLGVGRAFPGEAGGPRIKLNLHDPRGYPVTISRHTDGLFMARLTFPNWPKEPGLEEQWTSAAQGVKKSEYTLFDRYVGGADALAAAGLVRIDQLPGKPGMRKMRVTILPDGSLPAGAHTANHRAWRLPGARQIERAPASCYQVDVAVTEDEAQRRSVALKIAESAWRRQVRALPRPARLQMEQPCRRPLPTGWRVVSGGAQDAD